LPSTENGGDHLKRRPEESEIGDEAERNGVRNQGKI
jgi:hypothetical protein